MVKVFQAGVSRFMLNMTNWVFLVLLRFLYSTKHIFFNFFFMEYKKNYIVILIHVNILPA